MSHNIIPSEKNGLYDMIPILWLNMYILCKIIGRIYTRYDQGLSLRGENPED